MENENKNKELKSSMKTRHLVMLSLGGAIGAGLFAGAGSAISMAGPAVLITYIVSGLLLFVVMHGVGKIVIQQKEKSTGMSGLVSEHLGKAAGNFVDWVYWLLSLSILIAVSAPIAQMLQVWWPALPTWLVFILLAVISFIINAFSVRAFAEASFWMSAIKVAVLIVLMVLGIVLIVGRPSSLSNLNSAKLGGFAPHGFRGIFNAALIVIFSFGGSELAALSVAETKDPKRTVPKAIRQMVIQLTLVYVIPIFIFVTVYPWNNAKVQSGAVVAIFDKFHLPAVSNFVLAVQILALFSVLSSMYFGTIRSLYARSKDSENAVGKFFSKLSNKQVPIRANFFSACILLIGALLSVTIKTNLFVYMSSAISYLLVIVWIILLLASLKLYFKKPEVGTSFLKTVSIVTLLVLIAVLIGLVATTAVAVTIYAVVACLISFLSYFIAGSRRKG